MFEKISFNLDAYFFFRVTPLFYTSKNHYFNQIKKLIKVFHILIYRKD